MKKIILSLLIVLSVFTLTSCGDKEVKNTDAIKFKEEYEKLNGKKNSNGVTYREVEIDEDNPFVFATAEEIQEKIDNKETFAVYFGFNSCPWCRSIITTLVEVADDLNIEKIYYVDVLDIRDTYELNSKNKPEKTKDGSEGYNEIINSLESVLSDYTLTTEKGKTVKVGEKRIYAPNLVSVVDGKAQKLNTGISEMQTDSMMELTDEMKKDTYDQFKCVLDCLQEDVKVCQQGC